MTGGGAFLVSSVIVGAIVFTVLYVTAHRTDSIAILFVAMLALVVPVAVATAVVVSR